MPDSLLPKNVDINGAQRVITKEEENEILVVFNNTATDYPKEKTIVDLFEEQVAGMPANIALRQDGLEISYHALNEKANKLAHYLIKEGVKNGDNIGLLVTRSFDMITCMYAIMKAGGAYVPIEPDYPHDRQEYILHQSSVNLVITDTDYALSGKVKDTRFLNMNGVDLDSYDDKNPGLHISGTQLAYTIYTSGSTGKPKGVMIEHHSVVNLILWVNNTFGVNADDRLLFITSMCFDLSVYDIFGMLSSGGSIIIVNKHDVIDVKKLPDLLEQYGITFWDSVPTTLDYVVRGLESRKSIYSLQSLRLIFMSGDWIPVNLPGRIKKFFPQAKVISLGGATEGTVWSNFYPIDTVDNSWKSIPYGKPINNNTFYILDEQLQPLPYGVAGELYIGGVGVARGYANDLEKTNYSFVEDPFNKTPGGRMYRTGDLGRMLPGLNMEFIGRKDSQVKIRGFRVELGEVESVILQSGIVEQAIVTVTKDKEGNNRLAGYVVTDRRFNQDKLVEYMRTKLPEYMVPQLWAKLDQLPLTANGKIDRKSLPEIGVSTQTKSSYAAPATETEIALVHTWQTVLGANAIGIDDNFFDVGGQSLLAVELTNEIEEKFGKKFNIYTLFKYPTIRELVAYLEKDNKHQKEKVYKSLVPLRTTGKKMPIYLVHGDGLNVANFGNLTAYMDDDQPIYSLQPKGVIEGDEPLDDLAEIARHYVSEITDQNPDGPYALAGYSFGGYVAIEMRNQLEKTGRKVKMLAIFDTNAENTEYNRNWFAKLPRRIKRQVPKFLFILNSFIKDPVEVHKYQTLLLKRKMNNLVHRFGLKNTPETKGLDTKLQLIVEKHSKAFSNYRLHPFNDFVHLFKAKKRIYFVDDFKFLGWKIFARKGVKVYDIPGDHKTIFLPPNVQELARALQHALDNC